MKNIMMLIHKILEQMEKEAAVALPSNNSPTETGK
jgi:hypothetical protein